MSSTCIVCQERAALPERDYCESCALAYAESPDLWTQLLEAARNYEGFSAEDDKMDRPGAGRSSRLVYIPFDMLEEMATVDDNPEAKLSPQVYGGRPCRGRGQWGKG